MAILLTSHAQQLAIAALVLCRVGAMVATAPVFGERAISFPLRVMLALMLSVMIAPLFLNTSARIAASPAGFLLLVASELLVGAALGLGVAVLLSGAIVAGRLVNLGSGLSLAGVSGAAVEEETPVYAQLFHVFCLAVFVAIGGHRLVVGALLETFRRLPPGSAMSPASLLEIVVSLATNSLQLGLGAAAPVLAALLLTSSAMALLGRTLPYLNVMALGSSVNAIVAMLAVAVSLSAIGLLFHEQISASLEFALHQLTAMPYR